MTANHESRPRRAICVYCGSNLGGQAAFRETAARLGVAIAARGWTLVYGGATVGLMGVVAGAALERGGRVVGVIPEPLARKEIAHHGLTTLHRVSTMHERKQLMADLADAFVALPGGLGTLEEVTEAFVWNQLGLQRKPCGLLNVAGFYDPLLAFFGRMVEARFLRPEQLDQWVVRADPDGLLEALARAGSTPASR
jgi:uncharacterized protein (TIGR00730 family)